MVKPDKTIIILGSAGFIGKNLALQALEKEFKVIGIDKTSSKEINHQNYQFFKCPIEEFDFDSLPNENIHALYHLVARTDLNGKSIGDYKINYLFPPSLINYCRNNKIKFIFFSTQLVHKYGCEASTFLNADTYYGASKVIGELEVKNNFEDYLIVRPSSVWGPSMKKPYSEFFTLASKLGFVINSSLFDVLKSFYYVGNVLEDTQCSENLIYLTNQPYSLSTWMSDVAKSGNYREVKIPKSLIRLIFRLGWSFRIQMLNKRRFVNMTTSTQINDFIPIKASRIREGMFMTWQTFRK